MSGEVAYVIDGDDLLQLCRHILTTCTSDDSDPDIRTSICEWLQNNGWSSEAENEEDDTCPFCGEYDNECTCGAPMFDISEG